MASLYCVALSLLVVNCALLCRPDHTTPIEETVRAFNWVIEQGLAFYWCVSLPLQAHRRLFHHVPANQGSVQGLLVLLL